MSHQRKTNTLLTKASTILIESSRHNWIEKEIASIQITKYIHLIFVTNLCQTIVQAYQRLPKYELLRLMLQVKSLKNTIYK